MVTSTETRSEVPIQTGGTEMVFGIVGETESVMSVPRLMGWAGTSIFFMMVRTGILQDERYDPYRPPHSGYLTGPFFRYQRFSCTKKSLPSLQTIVPVMNRNTKKQHNKTIICG
jgi:hypothetical protein